MDEFTQECEALTKLIESCFDCNNPDDDLTFDERLQTKLNEYPELKKFSEIHHICD